MASTYSTNLAIELIGTGDQAGAWGNTTNTNLGTLIEQAISGYVTQAVSTGTDTTITIPNGATGVARNMYIELTGTGGTNTNLIVPSNKKLYFIFNNSTGAVTVKVSGQTGVSVPQGKKVVLTSNGTDVVNGLNYIADFGSNSATITQLTATSATITNLTLTSLVISNLSIASANITTLTSSSATISTTLALSGGTANGVLYLNGSKVATSGSALTFNGTTLVNTGPLKVGDGAASNTSRLMVNNATNTATGIQLFQDGIESWIMGMPANSAGLAWSASGAEQMRLNSTGLGIGTASPGYKLSVAGASGSAVLNLLETGVRSWGVRAGGTATNTFDIADFTAGATRLTIDSSGNLGIGTTSPGEKLNVVGGNNTTSTVNFTGGSNNDNATIASDYSLVFQVDANNTVGGRVFNWRYGGNGYEGGTSLMTLNASGNLGLGVTPSAWWSSSKGFQFGATGVIEGRVGGEVAQFGSNWFLNSSAAYVYTTTAPATRYAQNGGQHTWFTAASGTAGNAITFTQAMTLDASGNLGVGLGAATPSTYGFFATSFSGSPALAYASILNSGVPYATPLESTLYIGGARTDSVDNGNIAGYRLKSYTPNSTSAYFAIEACSRATGSGSPPNVFTERARITSGGDFIVGGTSAPLSAANRGNITVNGSSDAIVNLTSGGTSRAWFYATSTTAYLSAASGIPLVFEPGGAERARITSGGDFGIGTTSPATKLEVNGTTRSSAYNTTAGTVSVAPSTATTFFTPSSSGLYLARVYLAGNATQTWDAVIIFAFNATNILIVNQTNSTNVSTTVSGTAVRVTQIGASTFTMNYEVIRIG